MNRFFLRLQQFMHGRNGLDKFCGFLFIIYTIIVVLNFFFHSIYLLAAELLVAVYIVFRALSRNIFKRSKENQAYIKVERKVKAFLLRQKGRLRDIKTHRYIKCKNCKAQLRVKRIKGEHTVHCPKCQCNFKVKIH
ncbi:MAG: hypothetical protein IJV88_01380 [Ruminococcus sp.]|nr:hypothetical protein [Ruminococcus sp.]